MTRGEWIFVAACSLVVLVMLGTLSLAAGILSATVTGTALWYLMTAFSDPDEYQRRR